jgi:hypothetical protein
MRALQFLTFSEKLSSFTEILSRAKYDILFFVLMFAFVMILSLMQILDIIWILSSRVCDLRRSFEGVPVNIHVFVVSNEVSAS